PTAAKSVFELFGSIATSENEALVEMLVVVFFQVAPPSVDFQMPVLPPTPLTPPPPTATYTMLALLGSTTIREIVWRSNSFFPTLPGRRVQVCPASVDFRTPRP